METISAPKNTAQQEQKINISIGGSPGITEWLSKQNISLVFSSYQMNKFFLIGRNLPSGISVFQRNFFRCMGIAIDNLTDTIYLSSLYQIWKFNNGLRPGDDFTGYDRLYIPVTSYFTGEVDIHDLALLDNGELIFVNTLFSCLGKLSPNHSFHPFWRPKFITKLAPEDRCHLNGLAVQDGKPRYVTYFSQTNTPKGWRDYKENGGGIIDITTNEIICPGLTMPHSPRVHQNKCWVLNSGTGHLGYVDLTNGSFREVFFCPGYLRGLQLIGDYAIVGLSRLRKTSSLKAVQLENNLKKYNQQDHCGIYIINLKTGELEHHFEISGNLTEIYDIGILPGVVKPSAIGVEDDGIRRIITMPAVEGLTENKEFVVLQTVRTI